MKVVGRSKVVRIDGKSMIVLNDEVLKRLKVKEGAQVTLYYDENGVVIKKAMPGHPGGGSTTRGTGRQVGKGINV